MGAVDLRHRPEPMPCGHPAFSVGQGQSTLSMLDMEFATMLYPIPQLEDAVATTLHTFAALLSDVFGVV